MANPPRPSDAVKVVNRQTINTQQGAAPTTRPGVRVSNPQGVTVVDGVSSTRDAVKVVQHQAPGQIQVTMRQQGASPGMVTAIPQHQPVPQPTPGMSPATAVAPQQSGILPSAAAAMTAMGMTQGVAPPPGALQVQTVPTPAYANARTVDLTVFITVHDRPERLAEQTRAILTQSVKPKLNVAWVTFKGQPVGDAQFFMPVYSPIDWGPLPKFSFAKHVSSKYVAILEDDIVPGPQWLEAATAFLENNDVIIGAVGVRINEDGTETVYDWENQTGELTPVDYAKGGWIMKREHLELAMMDNGHADRLFGWQVHISARLQAHNIPTVILPYSEKTCGTSIPAVPGLSMHPKYLESKQHVLQAYLEDGWQLLIGPLEETPEAPIP